jgi:hypothetical protein
MEEKFHFWEFRMLPGGATRVPRNRYAFEYKRRNAHRIRTENPRVGSSILSLGTRIFMRIQRLVSNMFWLRPLPSSLGLQPGLQMSSAAELAAATQRGVRTS